MISDFESGYDLDFIVYTGSQSDIVKENHGFGKSGDIASTLINPYLEKINTLFVDNWYSSTALFCGLHDRVTNAHQTVRKNRRNLPRKEEKLKKGELSKREVWMLSTSHSGKLPKTGKKDWLMGEMILKHQCVVDYNKSTGALDKANMMLSSIDSIWKAVEWYKKLFFLFFDLLILNSFFLYRLITERNTCEMLETCNIEDIRIGSGRKDDECPSRLTARNLPSPVPVDDKLKKMLVRRSAVCSKHGKRK
ncbi:hypothetical protein J437_LFUL015202 [Ladona fulva]|uniref:PiggyBac transposable element-derived protein domain-containing protein n=1 Tax=Ladona fulva TaxID=123851 RepID=A0A8K0P6R3_LADFU|nr:hypothetical protein J437_LFUL015202 [Ladona fulva]